ncbi:Ezrin/radixin/moesin family protein [Cytophagales bacterium RKSG123]|nr:Ezrin/radixin/moesin family protein [Xanthovirga aplysinae]
MAQKMEKKERKEWKRKLRKLSPEKYKSLIEENNALKGREARLSGEVTDLESKVRDREEKISELQARVKSLKTDLEMAKSSLNNRSENKQLDENGVVFKVQIGAFKVSNISEYMDEEKNFKEEKSDDGLNKYTLGSFKDYWEADTFKKYLREMGVKDAWVVPYKDGERVPMKEVLEGVI